MPVLWHIESQKGWAILTISDPYTFEEWRGAMDGILRHPEFTPGYSLLVDRRASAPPDVTFVRLMTGYLAEQADARWQVRVAVVVPSTDVLAYGMGRMVENLSSAKDVPWSIHTFRSLPEAEAWLAQPDADSPSP
jgi:hypothetical protein